MTELERLQGIIIDDVNSNIDKGRVTTEGFWIEVESGFSILVRLSKCPINGSISVVQPVELKYIFSNGHSSRPRLLQKTSVEVLSTVNIALMNKIKADDEEEAARLLKLRQK